MKKYIPNQLEPKWQKRWVEEKLYSPQIDEAKKPYYSLMMFPYPSAEGLHVGNMYAFTGSDIFSRFKRMQGYDVFEPIGLDGFGIHSENYAMKVNKHPVELSKVTEEHFYEQLRMIGNSYDWTRTVETYKSNYYKWTQWLFLQMYKKELAYRKKSEVNWCPSCMTVLADEQVISGECERCSTQVVRKELEQWFFKITSYTEKLLANLDQINWSEKVKIAQRNWIGKSEGTLIKFDSLEVFTTRVDTIFGATFLVISPEHPLLEHFVTPEQKAPIQAYKESVKKKSELERKEGKKKTGVFTGSSVTNPLTGKKIQVWVADYVLPGYGTGAIMAVPAHDARDFEFAQKFGLGIKPVIQPVIARSKATKQSCLEIATLSASGRIARNDIGDLFEGEGVLVNSGEYTGLTSQEAKKNIADYLEQHQLGKGEVQYHLRDWLISRQRYWGPPIPIIYCEKCGVVPVREEDLPVELPFIENFRPTGTGKSPLALDPNFVNTSCPQCGGPAKRETDVSDTFLDSAWYFFRYTSTEVDDKAFDTDRVKKWLPVDMYIGGAEHSVLHLLYSRFVTMVLKDLGLIDFEEPFTKFRAHGLLIKDGAKMSKSKGNVINPDDYIKNYGADALRTYLMFLGPFSEGGDFRDTGMNGLFHFMERVWGLMDKVELKEDVTKSMQDSKIMAKTIKKVGEDIESLKYNTAIAALMEWLNHLSRKSSIPVEEYKTFLLLLAPFAPHITEELWQMVGEKHSIHQQLWPKFDEKYLEEEEVTVVVQVNGKVRDQLLIQKDIVNNKEAVEKMALGSEKLHRFLNNQQIKKSVYVPGKILNLVV